MNLLKNIHQILLILFPVFFITNAVGEIGFGLFYALSLIIFFFNKKTTFTKKQWILIGSAVAVYLAYISSLIFTSNLQEGFKQITFSFAFATFPLSIIFLGNQASSIDWIEKIQKSYIFIYSIISIGLISYILSPYFEKSIFTEESVLPIRVLFEETFSTHGTFLSMWYGLAVCFALLYSLEAIQNKNLKNSLLFGFCFLLLVYSQNLIFARTPQIVTYFICFLLVLWKGNKWIKISSFAFLILFITAISVIKPPVYYKLINTFSYKSQDSNNEKFEDTSVISDLRVREYIYHCDQELFWSLPQGHGVGDVMDALYGCYDQYNDRTNIFNEEHKDFIAHPHSQYFDALLTFGIIGVLALFFTYFYPLRYLYKDPFYLSFILIFALTSLTDTPFLWRSGVYFFAFFNSLFILKAVKFHKVI